MAATDGSPAGGAGADAITEEWLASLPEIAPIAEAVGPSRLREAARTLARAFATRDDVLAATYEDLFSIRLDSSVRVALKPPPDQHVPDPATLTGRLEVAVHKVGFLRAHRAVHYADPPHPRAEGDPRGGQL